MPGWRGFLDRFRPAGTPGAASPAGVPVDRAATTAAELLPLLDRLDAVQDEADRLRTNAREEAAHLRRAGTRAAAALVQQARDDTETIAAQAFANKITAAAADTAGADAEAATEMAPRGTPSQDADVQRVVAAARDLIAGLRAPGHPAVPG